MALRGLHPEKMIYFESLIRGLCRFYCVRAGFLVRAVVFLGSAVFSVFTPAQEVGTPGTVPGWNVENRQLVFIDDFAVPGVPDPVKWDYDLGDGSAYGNPGWGNGEAQQYTDLPENAQSRNGVLRIRAVKKDGVWTSARLVTRGKADWVYGLFEIRAKLPEGAGTWPAIWLFPLPPGAYGGWPASGEIDIMEHSFLDPEVVFGTVHFQPDPGVHNALVFAKKSLPSVFSEFHRYQLRWAESGIDLFIDDEYLGSYPNGADGPSRYPFDKPFYLILNLAMGGDLGGPIAETLSEAVFEIDYVKVWGKEP